MKILNLEIVVLQKILLLLEFELEIPDFPRRTLYRFDHQGNIYTQLYTITNKNVMF